MRRAALLMTAVAVVLAGCTHGSSRPTIGVSLPVSDSSFFKAFLRGARTEAKRQGAVLKVSSAANRPGKQVSQISAFVNEGVDAVVVDAVDLARVAPAMRKAKEAGVPVIAVGQPVVGQVATAAVLPEDALAGKLAAEFLFVRMGGTGHAAEFLAQSGSDAGALEGFREIAKQTTTVSVVTKLDAGPSSAQAAKSATALFKSDPKLNGVFAGTDEIALGVIEAARHAGILKRVAVVGLGGAPKTFRAIQTGDLEGVVVANAEALGRLAVRSAAAAADGRRVPPKETVDVKLVTKENVKAYLP